MAPLQASLGTSPHSNPHTPITVCLVGAGTWGSTYHTFALKYPHLMKIVAVVSPVKFRRNTLAQRLDLPSERVFSDWRELASLPKIADAVLITTSDSSVYEACMLFAQLKYHILLEEPHDIDIQKCHAIVEAAAQNSVVFSVGNSIRYTSCNRTLKKIVDSGSIGEIMSIQHLEKIGFQSLPYSITKSSRRHQDSSLALVTKNIDGIELVSWLMDSPCRKISAFGNMFQNANKKSECAFLTGKSCANPVVIQESRWAPYSSDSLYYDIPTGFSPFNHLATPAPSPLETDIYKNHVVNMEFDEGKTCSFTLISGGLETSRTTRIFGTLGELECDGNVIRQFDFLTRRSELIRPDVDAAEQAADHDGDYGLIEEFLENIRWGRGQWGPEHGFEELRSRMYVLAAEQAQASGSVVNVDDCRTKWFGDVMEVY
ncbi:NAD(P)-binding protein [Basidiobolus meristosporus CBS 931.73]|uniref:NAD(P)-binding protein n=1 Tax=Basidiobolus meristosporus CBS 931.73 TaxID=1314790 RepID=A0A1Y1YX76_9FUNG|nr:NAD(P)-binding protein [Basidiobolus meristosporus CBS 931.73]ORY02165.1 NAD(P)-binding protein [Basidiobolus meristosporus CBS 931.73]|eukprot:ORX97089.1 NAD(P)-binding protein [Basidiobolus meristosporus CBS 931.73]